MTLNQITNIDFNELSTLVKKNHDGILDNETVQQIEGEIKSLNEGLARLIPQRMDVVYQNMTLLDIAKMERWRFVLLLFLDKTMKGRVPATLLQN